MAVHVQREEIETEGNAQVVDLNLLVEKAVADSGLGSGVVTVFAAHSTVGITTMECEPGAVADLSALFRRLVPQDAEYHHNRINADTNGHAHAQAAVLGPSVAVPFVAGRPLLGTWQSVVAVDFDDRPRRRHIVFHVIGE